MGNVLKDVWRKFGVLSWKMSSSGPLLPTKNGTTEPQIEDFPSGYPQFTAFIAGDSSFHVCRRFAALRVRLLLSKQDELSLLEQRLDCIDRQEPKLLFLGSMRRDKNAERKEVLKNIDTALADYDALVERNDRALARGSSSTREVTNLQRWIAGSGAISRQETTYLDRKHDLMTLGVANTDCALNNIAVPLERLLMWFPTIITDRLRMRTTRDRRVWMFPRTFIQVLGRVTLAFLLVTLLLSPIVTMYFTTSLKLRVMFIWLFSAMFIVALAIMTKARTPEVFVAGTTYTAILVVFITSNSLKS